ncbi:MAG: hypothetical protein OEY14_12320 [Myxococcales bacterium]|nr:hypothetical protein [Myxococcales bacterium]
MRPVRPAAKAIRFVRISRHRVDADGEPIPLARGGLASVYIGRLAFEDGSRSRVAIKRFRRPPSDREAAATQRCIEALVAAGVRLPKTVMHQLDCGEWVQVSQLFGSWRRGSKLAQEGRFFLTLEREVRAQAIAELARVVNAAHRPALDLFVTIEQDRVETLPLDFDLIGAEPEPAKRSFELLRCAMTISDDREERRALLEICREILEGEAKADFERRLSDPSDPFAPYWRA